jgi:hypothetical protein
LGGTAPIAHKIAAIINCARKIVTAYPDPQEHAVCVRKMREVAEQDHQATVALKSHM